MDELSKDDIEYNSIAIGSNPFDGMPRVGELSLEASFHDRLPEERESE